MLDKTNFQVTPDASPEEGKRKSILELSETEFEALKKTGKYETINLAELNLDLRYQFDPETESDRKATLLRWLHERGGYDPMEHGPLFINRRPDGSLWNMDGGGGAWMAGRTGLTKHVVIAFNFPTWEMEAAFFRRKNKNRRQVSKAHLFRTDAKLGIEPNATIVGIVDEAEYLIVSSRGHNGMIVSPGALCFVFALDQTGILLRKTLFDLRNSVGDDLAGGKKGDSRLVVAVGILRAAFPQLDSQEIRDAVRRDPSKKAPKHEDVAKSVTALLAVARSDALPEVSNPQPRDTNPKLVKRLIARLNHGRAKTKTLSYDSVLALKGRVSGLGKDVWSWER